MMRILVAVLICTLLLRDVGSTSFEKLKRRQRQRHRFTPAKHQKTTFNACKQLSDVDKKPAGTLCNEYMYAGNAWPDEPKVVPGIMEEILPKTETNMIAYAIKQGKNYLTNKKYDEVTKASQTLDPPRIAQQHWHGNPPPLLPPDNENGEWRAVVTNKQLRNKMIEQASIWYCKGVASLPSEQTDFYAKPKARRVFDFLIGAILHMVQDSFSAPHSDREPPNENRNRGYSNVNSKSENSVSSSNGDDNLIPPNEDDEVAADWTGKCDNDNLVEVKINQAFSMDWTDYVKHYPADKWKASTWQRDCARQASANVLLKYDDVLVGHKKFLEAYGLDQEHEHFTIVDKHLKEFLLNLCTYSFPFRVLDDAAGGVDQQWSPSSWNAAVKPEMGTQQEFTKWIKWMQEKIPNWSYPAGNVDYCKPNNDNIIDAPLSCKQYLADREQISLLSGETDANLKKALLDGYADESASNDD